MNYYERHLGDYSKDTAHLSMLEHGAYTLLLDRYYSTEQPIPADQAHRVARARSREEKAAVDVVLGEFFELAGGLWINRRAEEEIEKAQAKISAAKENGKKGGRPKKVMPGSEKETQQKPTGLFVGSENETQQKAHQAPSTRHQTPDVNQAQHDGFTDSARAAPIPVSGSRIGGLCQRLRPMGVNASPALFAKPGWDIVLARFDDEFIAAIVEQKLRANPGESFSAAYFLPVLTDIINNPAKPQSGGIHAERQHVLDQLTGRTAPAPELNTIDGEGNVIG